MNETPAEDLESRLVLGLPEPLRTFNEIGVLSAADVHVARTLATLAGEGDGSVALAVALAVRAPRLGHVFVDLETVRDTAAVESDEIVDLSELPWPDPGPWRVLVAGSTRLVALGDEDDGGSPRPLRLIGSRLYLDRYWREERQVAADLLAAGGAAVPPASVDRDALRSGLERLFGAAGSGDELQRCAGAAAVLRRLSVIAGGPGTGKTTTVARVAALLYEQAAARGEPVPLIALTAPTGKAAARLQESVHDEARSMAVSETVLSSLLELRAGTIHRLLGTRFGSHTRFRHHRSNALPHDVVIVDETSMISLTLMARLLEAVRPEARVVLVGDPGQLTAIEAGAVLRDIVGQAGDGLRMSGATTELLSDVVGSPVAATAPPEGVRFGDGIVVLDRVHRFGEQVAAVADAIRRGDGDQVIAQLRDGDGDEVLWLPVDGGDPVANAASLELVRGAAVTAGRAVLDAARAGDAAGALDALGGFRLLCAHRRGPHGVATWTGFIERWLSGDIDAFDPAERDYIGRPLLITQNDYELRLFNGDTGVIVRGAGDRLVATFDSGGSLASFTPARLAAVETVYAMTIHKSQGSQFETAAVVLPDPSSRILTRELLYTAVTRARERLILVGTEDVIRTAVARPVARATGLGERLWGARSA
jgi:exodeoxyribonuclease V alpha subunit